MDIFNVIQTRHSTPKVKADPVPRAVIEELLDAAVQAPDHYRVHPWRFVVLTGNGRAGLGQVMAESFSAKNPNVPSEAIEKTRGLPLRAPVLIAVGVDKPTEPRVLEIENICATAAACQNILLAAHAQGLGVQWRTGEWARDPRVKQFLGFAEDQHLIAFLYIGYPDMIPDPTPRTPFQENTTWME